MCRVENNTNSQTNKLYPSLSSPSTTSFLRKYVFKKREGKKLLGVITLRFVPFHGLHSLRNGKRVTRRRRFLSFYPLESWDSTQIANSSLRLYFILFMQYIDCGGLFVSFRFVLKAAVDRFKYICGVPVGSWQLSAETPRQYVVPFEARARFCVMPPTAV